MEQLLKFYDLLPTEIAADIFCRLPIDSLTNCKLVCKTWCALISDPVFIHTHTQRLIQQVNLNHHQYSNSFILAGKRRQFHYGDYNSDDESFKVYKERNIIDIDRLGHDPYSTYIAGSCNGLVCLCSYGKYRTGVAGGSYATFEGSYVCNPVTREYLTIPIQKYEFDGIISSFVMASGFGYHPCTKEYKIVRVAYFNHGMRGMIQVYTLGSGRWRSKGEINHSLHRRKRMKVVRNSIANYLNGALYWMNERMEIISFDLADEVFRIVPAPPCFDELGVLGGCLCATQHNFAFGVSNIWVLMMMNKDEECCWIEKFSIEWEYWPHCYIHAPIPIALLSNGNFLLHSNDSAYIAFYDPRTRHFAIPYDIDDPKEYQKMFPFVKSFVSLKALQEEEEEAAGSNNIRQD